MRRLPFWALALVLTVLAARSGQATTPAVASTPYSATVESSAITLSPTNVFPTPLPQGTPESTPVTSTPTPASSTKSATLVPTQEPTIHVPTPTAAPATTLSIAVAQIQSDIPEYDRPQWKHWTDADGDCQDARQEALISESLVEVTFESERKCRVAMGRWYGAFTGVYVEAPGDLDVDHLVPLKNAHDSGGWAWNAARKQEYANHLGHPDHLIAVTNESEQIKGRQGTGGLASSGRGLPVPVCHGLDGGED